MLYNVSLSDIRIIASKCKEVLFISKANRYDWLNKIHVNVLKRFCCFWLEVAILLLLSFCSFITIANKSLYIVNKFNTIVYKILF